MKLQIQMLGGFSICNGSNEVSQSGNRSKKHWSLMAYMIYHRSRAISSEKLIELLWGDDDKSSDPLNALKVVLHRIRNSLNKLDDSCSAGHALIVCKEGNYFWNTEIPMTLDIDDFEKLCRSGENTDNEDKKLEYWLKALDLYKGDFLPSLTAEPWIVPITTYYHNMYIETVQAVLPLLEAQERYKESAQVCRAAIALEPYQEEFYRHLMHLLCKVGDQKSAVSIYEEMREMFFSNFGVMPSEETQALYRRALSDINDRRFIPSGTIMDQLREPAGTGAFVCDYDVFKHIYRSTARSIVRSGDIAHIALFSLNTKDGGKLPKRSLDTAAENLGEILRTSLRRGDIVSRCSISQFVVMLNQSNYENSQMVCQRMLHAFTKKYPHSPALVSASVHPIEPN